VRSNASQTLWVEVNRAAHQQVNFLLTGKRPANAAIQVSTMRGGASGQHGHLVAHSR
jgi:hypothetical protein